MRRLIWVLVPLALAGCGVKPFPERLTCQRFQRPVVIDGVPQPVVSTHCLDAEGGWALRGLGDGD